MAENKNQFFSGSISEDMEKVSSRRASAFRRDGSYSPSAWLDFVGQFNSFARPASPRFRPIKGDKFLL